jgi:hypothetical protein
VRYGRCFKQAVIADFESGRFSSLHETRQHYGIKGTFYHQAMA